MENINKFTVRKQITEHVAGMEFPANVGGGDGLYFHINADGNGGTRHTSNISPSDVCWCEVDALGYTPSFQLDVIGTGILYVIVHPDIYVPDNGPGLKNPICEVKDDRSSVTEATRFYNKQGLAVNIHFNSLVSGDHKLYAAIFVSSLDDLKNLAERSDFRMRENPEFHPVRFVEAWEIDSPADDVLHGVWFSQGKFNGEIVTE